MSLLYDVVKIPVYLTHAVYFKKVHVLNLEKVPVNKPVMLLPNHPNAFLDAVVVSIQLHQQVNFLVRSDVFNTPLKKWLLARLNNYPIYRIQEGTENLKKNEETFRLCSELFRQNKTILIFPEGICIREKRLRKLKKGAARIAFGSEEQSDFSLDLQLVPVGVNYSEFGKIGGELVLNFGDPISIISYKEQYAIEKAKAINDLTSKIEEAMLNLVINVPTPDEDALFNDLETIRFTKEESGREKFNRKKKLSDDLHILKKNHPELLQEVKQLADSYFTALRKHDTKDEAVTGLKSWSVLNDLGLFLTSPLFLFGAVLNILPLKLTWKLSNKAVSKEEFFDSVNMIGGMFIFIFYYLLMLIPLSFIAANGYQLVLLIFSLPLAGRVALEWWYRLKAGRSVKAFRSMSAEEKEDLKEKRALLMSKLNFVP